MCSALVFGQVATSAVMDSAGAAGLSTNFFDYQNHDVATSTAGLVDWANNGALTSSMSVGGTWTRAGSQGVFDGGVYQGSTKPPTPPSLTATASALIANGTMEDAKFVSDPISSDSFTCNGANVSGDPTTFAGAGSETNNGLISTFTYGTSGNTPPKDEIANAYAVSRDGGTTNEVFFGGERIVNNGASHIDFEFLQAQISIPNPCGAGTFSGHRTQRDLLLSTDFTNGGALAGYQLYSWSCNGKAPGAAGYDASKDFTVCDPAANGNPGNGDPQYVAVPSVQNGNTIVQFGVNTGANGVTCGGWVCRDSSGAGTTTLAQNTLMEGGIDLPGAGFTGCFNTFLPHTRTSPSFTSVLKDFAGPIGFSNCKTPTVTTTQSSTGVTSGANITVGVGSSVSDTATLTGAASHVGGTVSYKLFSDAACTVQVGSTSTKPVNGTSNNGTLELPSSDPIAVNTAGTYYWTASYSGDTASGGQNNAATSGCGDEVLTVVAPSLAITKTADAATVSAGDAMGFTVTVTNNGLGAATNTTITDALPGGTGVSWSISPAYAGPGTCGITGSAPSQTLGCALGTLAPGASASVHVTSATARTSCGAYPNSATVAASNNPTVPPATASVTVQCPDLSITKTADSTAVSAGDDIGFTMTVSNAGPGTAKSVTLSDPLPSGPGISWTISPANAACSITAGTLNCNFGDLAANTSASVHVTSPTVFASCATYPNTASAQASNNPQVQASASVSVQCPGLHITKTADAASVNAGEAIGFTMTVSNSGPGTARGVTLNDPLPTGAGVSWSISPANAACSITTGTLHCNFGDLAASTSVSVHVTSPTANASCGAYPNTATASATNDGSVQASDTTTVNCPNLVITKTADAATANVGDTLGFTITVQNTGVGVAKSVTVHDPLPTGAGITWSVDPAKAGCAIASNTLDCNVGDMAQGASFSVHVSSPTGVGTPCTAYPNTATAQATNNPQVQASATTTLQCPALQVTKTPDAPIVSAGDTVGFTITVQNTGAGTAKGVTLTDPLPGGGALSWSTASAGCSVAGSAPNQTLNCTFGDLASGASASAHVTSATSSANCGVLDNTATAAATNAASAQASASITVNCPNLTITKTADASSVSAGSAIGFTITVSNSGPGTAKAVTLTDPLPTGAGINWTIDPAKAGCSITANALSCNFGDLAAGQSQSVHISSPTTGASCATYTNTATAQATNHAPVSATASTSVQCPGLQLTKTPDAASVNAGEAIGFTMTVGNTGAGTATGVSLSDPLPTGSGISWTISPAKAGCSITANTLTCNFGDLASGASQSVHVTSPTTYASCGTYDNTATATSTNGGSAQASASTTVNCPNLVITKTADAASVSAGSAIGFTITVQNAGAGVAKAVTLNDPLPIGSGISWSMSPANADCSVAANTLSCDFGDMASGASTSVHITSATAYASCSTYPNTATANATNNPQVQASASTTVQCPVLSIVKTADASPVSAGDPIGFSITVSNSAAAGTGTATAVTLTDPLPSGNGVSWSIAPAYAGPGTCSVNGAAPNQTLSCAFGDMAPGASISVHLASATTGASAGTYPNTATAVATNHPSVQASATIIVQSPALSITKQADASPVSAGDPIGFSITVSNSGAAGTGTAKSVTLNDPLPSGNGVSWSIAPAYAGPGTCSISGSAPAQTLTCSFGDIAPGGSVSVHISSATTGASAGTYPNTATASATNAPDVSASATIVVQAPALSITKTADASPVDTGDPIGFTVTVTNSGAAGTGTARSVTLSDPLPSGNGVSWSITPAYAGPGSCSITGSAPAQTLTCAFGDMAPGAAVSVHVTSATGTASAGTYPNTATASATNAPDVSANATIVVRGPALSITKTADASPVNTGDEIGFTITVSDSNAEGTGTAKSVVLDDPLPSGPGIDWSIDPATAGCAITAGSLHCTFGDMAPGTSKSVHVVSATTGASAGTYPNTAAASASNHGPVEASAQVVVLAPALSITKTADAAQVTAGDAIGFTVKVANSDAEGTGVAYGVKLSDPLPGGDGVHWAISPAYAGPGTCSITGSAPKQTLACAFGDMAPGASVSVHVTSATSDASVGTYDNTATVSARNASSKEASATTKVVAGTVVTEGTSSTTTVAPTTTTTVAPQPLPFTGGATFRIALIGLLVLLCGAVLAMTRRRRAA